MRLPFLQATVERPLRQPAPPLVPTLPAVGIAALYRGARMGGDFYDFAVTQDGRLVFLLLDIAGKRKEALDIAASVQQDFREKAPEMFHGQDINQSDALNNLSILLNRAILKAEDGVRHAPAFVGCYDPALGMLTYVNAGHTPALLKDTQGITLLKANGIPLGLFSHATHDAAVAVMQPGAALLVVSKGLVESGRGSKEFGLERVVEVLQTREFRDAQELCAALLGAVETFTRNAAPENDTTMLALMRAPGERSGVLP
jgi:serine phosphatase RsbU (regulator of sigma subunit)